VAFDLIFSIKVFAALMGMILAAIAMQMIVASLKAAFGLPH